MGTSSSYGGPSGKPPLVPDDFDGEVGESDNDTESEENPSSGEPDEQEPTSEPEQSLASQWTTAKTLTSKYASGSTGNYRKIMSSHVKAYGGAGGASKTASAGKATTLSLGSFFSNVSANGIKDVLEKYNIKYEGRGADEVLSDIVNKLAPSPDTKEEAVARNAFLDAMELLYEEVEENGGDIEALDNLDSETCNNAIKIYIASYIYQRFLKDLESRFEAKARSTDDALSKENDIKEYIQGVVDNTINNDSSGQINFNSKEISKQIDSIYKKCYEVIEGAL